MMPMVHPRTRSPQARQLCPDQRLKPLQRLLQLPRSTQSATLPQTRDEVDLNAIAVTDFFEFAH